MYRTVERQSADDHQTEAYEYTTIGSSKIDPVESVANDNLSAPQRRDILANRRRRWARISVR